MWMDEEERRALPKCGRIASYVRDARLQLEVLHHGARATICGVILS